MSAKHTPGPWVVTKENRTNVIRGAEVAHRTPSGSSYMFRDFVASTWGGENEGNARLIAAAPELLDACRAMIEWDYAENNHSVVDFYDRMELCRVAFNKVRDAIAKATGEQS